MKKPINYAYLYNKYIGGTAKVTVLDRSFDGLVIEGAPKPSKELFESFQAEEDRLAKAEDQVVFTRLGLMEERQHQARVQAEQDAIPLEEKISKEWSKIREEVLALKAQAKEAQEALKAKDEMLDCWHEISAAQAMINAEAEDYLKETDWYVTRKHEEGKPIPPDVAEARLRAKNTIQKGKLVFQNAEKLRALAMPSRDEIKAAIVAGGEELAAIKKAVQEVHLKYPKPRRQRGF